LMDIDVDETGKGCEQGVRGMWHWPEKKKVTLVSMARAFPSCDPGETHLSADAIKRILECLVCQVAASLPLCSWRAASCIRSWYRHASKHRGRPHRLWITDANDAAFTAFPRWPNFRR
jgi:hypothetical protein